MAHCILCPSETLVPDARLYALPTVTSDCRPWMAGRSIAVCRETGMARRIVLPEASDSFRKVYDGYAMFKHSQVAADQMHFDRSGAPQGRTQKILTFIAGKLPRPPASVLDVGSGSGAGLLALASQFPDAAIFGYEPNDHPQERQSYLPENVVTITNQQPEGERFDLITLFHVFEHIEDLSESLAFVKESLTSGGHLLIQVPYPASNPFDFIIADHIWHFSKRSLAMLLRRAGFIPLHIGNDLIRKELTVVATPGKADATGWEGKDEPPAAVAVDWLVRYGQFLDDVKRAGAPVIVYGTGPAAAWASTVLGDCVRNYVDEDPTRIGSVFNDRPVLPLAEGDHSLAFVAPFPDAQARQIAARHPELNILGFGNQGHATAS